MVSLAPGGDGLFAVGLGGGERSRKTSRQREKRAKGGNSKLGWVPRESEEEKKKGWKEGGSVKESVWW